MFFKKKIETTTVEEPETGNTLKKGKKKEEEKEEKPKAGATIKSKKAEAPQEEAKPSAFIEFLKSEKTKNITGLIFLLGSIYLLIAFTSYLFTWQEDQDKVTGPWMDLLGDSTIQVNNWLGKLGAIVSHVFFYKWFGLISYVFPFLLALFGTRLFFKKTLLPLKRSTKLSVIALAWTSIALGYVFQYTHFAPGGSFGYQTTLWLQDIVGGPGAGFLIFFTLLAIMVLNFNFSMDKVYDSFKKDAVEIEPLPTPAEEELPKNDLPVEEPILEVPPVFIPPDLRKVKKEIVPEPAPIVPEPIVEEDEDVFVGMEKTGDVEFKVEAVKIKEEILSQEEINSMVQKHGEYDPTLDLSSYTFPGIDLLKDYGDQGNTVEQEELEANKNRIVATLKNYNIEISQIKATIGPTVTLYEIIPAPGVRISKIKNLEDDIALSLSAFGIRIIAPIPGKGTIGIEVPNQKPDVVSMKTVIASKIFQDSKMELPIVLGKTISNEIFVTDLAKMPHLLMAGATGQGKSVGLNAILVSLLYKKHPSQLKLVLVDPKKVELTLYNKLVRHFLAKLPDGDEAIITDTKKVVNTVNSLCIEMDTRYELLKVAQCRNIKEYNTKFVARKLNPENGHKYLPYIVLVIDEFADLIMTAGKEIETPIARLAQLARAIGIHLIVATQRPSVNIITGTIKANFPARIAFKVTSKIDSRTILDAGGADQLIGRGDMLLSTGNELLRIQCAFVDTPEVEDICSFIGEQRGYSDAFLLPEYNDPDASSGHEDLNPDDRDPLFVEAAKLVVTHQQGSASLLQRRLKLGYNRAGRIVDQLEAAGIIGPFEGSKARQVLYPDEHSLEQYLNTNKNNNTDSSY
ncbi:MAG: DNA translocase FtsK 4TM domain-containing protein [Bacteroidetes bacterium]|nr:DNA translocase FtsK 4TM domain-containing protein [Bacteroidota bacterium]